MRVGVVGCGLIGRRRASVVHASPSDEIIVVADIDRSRAVHLASELGCQASTGWREIADRDDIEAVVVSTINKALMPVTVAALEKGKHVLCEKPLGRNSNEARHMVDAAYANRRILKTGFNHRHHPAIARSKELVDRGEIGPLHFLRCRYGHGGRPGYEKEWRADGDLSGGGELLDQGVHVVDLFRWFLGDFEEAFGWISNFFWEMGVEDNGFAMFKTGARQVAFMHTSWTQWKNMFSFEIFGEAGYLVVEGLGGSYGTETLKIGKRKIANDRHLFVRTETNQRITNNSARLYAGGAPDEETVIFDGPDISWEKEWAEFAAAIKESREPLGNGQDGLEANRMLEAIYASARENRPVNIEQDRGVMPH